MLIKLQNKHIIKYYYFEETEDHMLLALEKCLGSLFDFVAMKDGIISSKKNRKRSDQEQKEIKNVRGNLFSKEGIK